MAEPTFVFVKLSHRLIPIERSELFEDPLDAQLDAEGLGAGAGPGRRDRVCRHRRGAHRPRPRRGVPGAPCDGVGGFLAHWQGPTETALYVYGASADELTSRIQPLLSSYPLCQGARVVRIA